MGYRDIWWMRCVELMLFWRWTGRFALDVVFLGLVENRCVDTEI